MFQQLITTETRHRAALWLLLGLVSVWSLMGGRELVAQVTFLGSQSTMPGLTLQAPYGVATDQAGNVYISDPQLREVVCVTASHAPCGAPFPVQQGLVQPKALAMDVYGNLFVADVGVGEVLEMVKTASGYASPIALTGHYEDPEAIALDPNSNLFVADEQAGTITELPLQGGEYGQPTVMLTGLMQPEGLAFDPYFTMYIAQQGQPYPGIYRSFRTLQQYSQPTGFIGLPGTATTHGVPGSITFTAQSNLLVADVTTHQVMEYGVNRFVPHETTTAVIGVGLNTPAQTALDAASDVWIADSGTGQLVEFSTAAKPFDPVAVGTQTAPQSLAFSISAGTTVGSFQVFTQGSENGEFQRVAQDTCVAGSYPSGGTCLLGVTLTPQQSGSRKGAVVVRDDAGNALTTVYLSGNGIASRMIALPATVSTIASGLPMPTGVTVDNQGDLFVSDSEVFTVTEYMATGNGFSAPKELPIADLNTPVGMAVDGAGNLLIASSGNDRVIRAQWNGSAFAGQENVGTGMYVPSGVAVAPDGSMCVANTYENQVNCYEWTGTSYVAEQRGLSHPAGGTFAASYPISTAMDAVGNVFWLQKYQSQLIEFNPQQSTMRNLWEGFLDVPTAVVVDGEDDVYVLDSGHNRVMMLVPQNGTYQRPILVASGFNAPQGLAIDSMGNLYVADTGNHRVVKISMRESAPMNFAPAAAGSSGTATNQAVEWMNVGAASATLMGISYPADFQQGTTPSGEAACSAGMTLQSGQSCWVSAIFTPQTSGAQMNESIVVTAQMASGQAQSYSVPVQGNSLNQLPQTISFPAQAPIVYGQQMVAGQSTFSLSAQASSGLAVSYAIVSGPGVLSGSGSTLEGQGVGTIVVRATQMGNAQYAAAAPVEQSFTVLPATLTVTASDQQVAYGASPSSFGYTISGFVGSDTAASVVSGNPVISSSVGAHPVAGTYAIQVSAGTLASANYNFAFVAGKLTIAPAVLTVTAISVSSSYGQPLPAFSYSLAGFQNGDTAATLSGQPGFITSATSISPVGSYALNLTQGTLLAANYSFRFVAGTISITPGTLTVVASNQSITYGSSVPKLSYTLVGLSNGDQAAQTVTGTPALSTSYVSGSGTGSYTIQVAQGSLIARNYQILFQPGTLTVLPATLTLVPNTLTMPMGTNVPPIRYQAIGLAAGDTLANATTGAPVLSTTATAQSLPGTYPILMEPGTMRAKNYTIQCMQGVLQVTWSGGNRIDPPGVFAPTPVRLHGAPVLPQSSAGRPMLRLGTSTGGDVPVLTAFGVVTPFGASETLAAVATTVQTAGSDAQSAGAVLTEPSQQDPAVACSPDPASNGTQGDRPSGDTAAQGSSAPAQAMAVIAASNTGANAEPGGSKTGRTATRSYCAATPVATDSR